MKKKLLVTTLIAINLIASGANAQTVPASAQPQNIQKRFDKPLAQPTADTVESKDSEDNSNDADTKKILKLNDVKFEGNTAYSSAELEAVVSEYIGREVSFYDLQNMVRDVTKKYRNDGYILSKAILTAQKIKDGTVVIKVIEGYISEVNLVGEVKGNVDILRGYAEKISQKRPINKRDLERYLLLADDLPGVTATSFIRPSTKVAGSSELVLNLEHKSQEFSVSTDNFGSRFVGPYEFTAIGSFNSAFGLYERTAVRAINTFNDELTFFDLAHEEQLGGEGAKITGIVSRTASKPGSRLESLDIDGISTSLGADITYPIIRSRRENLNVGFGIKADDSETDLSSTNVSKDKVRTIKQQISYEFDDSLNSANKISLTAVEGFDGLGSTNDGVGRSRTNGNHEFIKGIAEYIRLQGVTDKINVLFSGVGQYSNEALLASEEVAFGGRTYGRGYDSSEIIGDNGAAALIEFRYNTDYVTEYLNNIQYYASYDIAGVWNKDLVFGDPKKQTLASAALGTRFNVKKDVSADLSIAAPLTREVNAEGKSGDEPRLFFSLTKRF